MFEIQFGFEQLSPLQLHTARWVVPVSKPPLERGAVAIFGNKVVGVGPVDELRASLVDAEHIDHGDSVIIPGLINCHSHLELSPLKWRLSPSGSFTAWIRNLIKARENIEPHEYEKALEEAVKTLHGNGVAGLADTGNTALVWEKASSESTVWPFTGVHFKEILHPEGNGLEDLIEVLRADYKNSGRFNFGYSAHSVYTVAPKAIQAIKARDNQLDLPFSIHVAESQEEIEFLRDSKGPIFELLKEKGRNPVEFKVDSTSPVKLLKELNVLDKRTICVHCVHIDELDIEILAASKASVCLCPRSNMFLGVGTPPVEKLMKAGINIALGTDSLASNDRLSIFAEMASLARQCPQIDTADIFKAATVGGAAALNLKGLGTLDQGSAPLLYVIKSGPIGPKDLFDYLVFEVAEGLPESYWAVEETSWMENYG